MNEQSAPRGDRGLPVLLLLAAFGAGVTGGLVAHWMDTDAADSSPVSPSSADRDGSAQIAAEVHALTQAIERLGQRPAVSPASVNAETSSVEPLRPDSSTAALEEAITRLVDALGPSARSRPALADRASLRLPADPEASRSKLLALRGKDRTSVRREHLLTSMQEVIERYGIPDRVMVDSGVVYLIWQDSDQQEVAIKLYDGIVIGMELPR